MPPSISPPRRRVLALSLRMMVVAVVAVACGLGWMVYRIRVQRQAVASIKKAGGFVIYDWEWKPSLNSPMNARVPGAHPPGASWLRRAIGPEMFETVRQVDFLSPATPDDAVMAKVGQLRGVRKIWLPGRPQPGLPNKLTGASLASFAGMTGLEFLHLAGVAPTDAELGHLAGLTSLKSLGIDGTNLTSAGLKHLGKLKDLTTLSLGFENPGDGKIDSTGLAELAGLTKLEVLWVKNARITTLAPLKGLTSLRILVVDGNPVDDAGLAGLAHHPSLRNFSVEGLGGVRVTDKTMKVLGTIPHLIAITASGPGITDQGLRDIAGLAELKTLRLTAVRARDFSPLAGLTGLQTLSLLSCPIDEGGMAFLAHMPSLRKLWLDAAKLSDADCVLVGQLQALNELTLKGAGITDVRLKHLAGLTGLQALTLDSNPITDAGLAHLAGMKQMVVLSLAETRVTGQGLAALLRMPLQRLTLSSCPIDSEGLRILPGFCGLILLALSQVPLTDADVPTLAKLAKCRNLIIEETGITPAGLAALRKALPKATIRAKAAPRPAPPG